MSGADISIITPWIDHPEFIADYERAVTVTGVQVIVIDNGSARLVAQTLDSMVRRLGGLYIRNEQNKWFSAANNQGLACATGRIVLFMNNDIVASPNWLEAVRQDVLAGGLYGPSLRNRVLEETETNYIEGWCIAGVREVWDRLGGWNADAFQMPYWEDAELCWRADKLGIRLHQTGWKVVHKVNGTSASLAMANLGINLNKAAFIAAIRGEAPPSAKGTDQPVQPQPLESYIVAGRLSDAERDYRTAVQREPNRADLQLGYCLVLACCGRSEAANDALQQALRLNPAIAADAFTEMGILFDKLQRFDQAAAAFAEVASRRPQSWVARCNWAAALIRAGKYEQAATAARAAIALNDRWGPAHAELAHACLRQGHLEQALREAQTASQLQPASLTSFYVLGAALKALGRPEEALAALNQALAIDPAEPACQKQREEIRQQLGKKKF